MSSIEKENIWNWDDLPADVQQKIDNTTPGEFCEFTLEEDGEWQKYRLRQTASVEISKEEWESATRNGTTSELIRRLSSK
jgi:hypothetical protein